MLQRSIATLVASIAMAAWACPVNAADAGPPKEDAGPGPCGSSDECANPTPYCNVMLGKCVQCIADLNCFGIGLVCDQNRGVCTNCRSNADCYQPAPYCSAPLARCVECLTDSNCGKQGIKCMDGVCGSCGDGICSENERNGMFGFCNDCFAGCPKTDLKSKVGDGVVSATTSSTDGQFTTSCGTPPGAAATYSWTAPDAGSYAFTITGDAELSIYDTNCAGQPLSCNSYYAGLYLNKGQTVALIASGTTTTAGAKFQIGISANMVSSCNPMFCPVGPDGESPCCLGDQTCGLIDPTQGCVPPGAVKPPGTGGTTGSGTGGFPPSNSGGTFVSPNSGGTANGTGARSSLGTGGTRNGGTSTGTEQDGGNDIHHPSTTTSGGCGCTVPRDGTSSEGALASFALASLLAFARRRRGQAASR